LDKWNVSRAELEAAVGKFKQAVELDPQYALALAQLAYCYARIALFYEWNPFWFEQAKQTLTQADRLDPNLAESHVVRAFLYWSIYQNYQLDETLRELRLARQLDPDAGLALLGDLGLHLGFEEETWRVLRRASEIDPTSVLIQAEIAEAYAWFGKWDEALAAYDRVIAIEPNYQPPYHHGALCLLHQYQFGEAERRLERALALNPNNTVPMSYRALLLALRGEFQKAETEIPAIVEKGEKLRSYHHVTYSFACIYALQGKTEPAIKWLKKTGETGMLNYPMFARDPYLERIRQDSAFIKFMAANADSAAGR
jgi:tetratricopeptide (TPR) repeat protein